MTYKPDTPVSFYDYDMLGFKRGAQRAAEEPDVTSDEGYAAYHAGLMTVKDNFKTKFHIDQIDLGVDFDSDVADTISHIRVCQQLTGPYVVRVTDNTAS